MRSAATMLLLLLGCCDAAEQPQAATAEAASSEQAPEAPPPDDPLERLLHDKAKKYAAGMLPTTPTYTGKLAEGGKQDYLAVLVYGHCYRAVGVGGAGVEDLDLFLYDGSGVQTAQDDGEDPYPVLGIASEICPENPGEYRLQVRMYKGAGAYALRIYNTPPR